jgi:predicted RNase H-like HicB family nuclease
MKHSRAFIAVIRQCATGEFEARFPDLPYCVAFAATEEEAIAAAADALVEQLAELAQGEEPIPTPSTFAEILAESQWRGGLATRIQAATRAAGRPFDFLAVDNLACENAAISDNDERSF